MFHRLAAPFWGPVLLACLGNVVAQTNISLTDCCDSVQDATVWSLVYGIPLIAFANQTQKVFGLVGGANKINTQTGLASLSGAAVVKPNVDTVYSRVVIDLSKDDLVLTVPNITDRFSIFPFYDVFGNDFASISPVTHSTPGKYLLRRSDDALVQPGLHVLNTSEPHPVYGSKYQGLVNFPTTYGTMLIRILVKQNTTEDLDIVHRYQSQYTIEPTPRKVTQPGNSTSSSIVQTLNNVTTNVTSALPVLEFLAKIASFNQPEVLSDRYRVASILGLAGISNGRYVRPEVVNLTRAFEDAVSTYTNITSAPENINESLGNGWQLSNPPFEGNFTTNYAPRALVAQTGYQQLTPNIVIYPGYRASSFATYSLAKGESFLITFHGKPPIQGSSSLYPTDGVAPAQAGFWSLTVYGPDQYLIASPVNRFEVGDRTTSLAYADGSKVYSPNARPDKVNQTFQILMQPADVTPPSNWMGNWLPTPAGGGDLSFILRFYRPFPALTNGGYVYPKVKRIPVLRQ